MTGVRETEPGVWRAVARRPWGESLGCPRCERAAAVADAAQIAAGARNLDARGEADLWWSAYRVESQDTAQDTDTVALSNDAFSSHFGDSNPGPTVYEIAGAPSDSADLAETVSRARQCDPDGSDA